MENLIAVMYGITVATAVFAIHSWYKWRQLAMQMLEGKRAQSQEPEDREDASKREYERLLNALENERRTQHEAMLEAFEFLNKNTPFASHHQGLMQVRNMLMRTIQVSTYGRG